MLLRMALITLAALLVLAAIVIAYLIYWFYYPPAPKARAGGIRVACVGDSITQAMSFLPGQAGRTKYPALLQALLGDNYQVLNYGHGGRTLLDSGDHPYRKSALCAASMEVGPAIVLIMLGTNDSKPQNWNAAEYERQLAQLVETYRSLPGHPAVHLLTPPAAFVLHGRRAVAYGVDDAVIREQVVPIVKRVGEQMSLPVIDVFSSTRDHPEHFPDGVHPNALGDRVIAETVYFALAIDRSNDSRSQ